MEDLIDRPRLGDYAPTNASRLDIVSEYLRSFLPMADEDIDQFGWGLTLDHADDGGVRVEAQQYAAPKRKRDAPVLVAVFKHTYPADCFCDEDGLANETENLLPEEHLQRKWIVKTEIHTTPTTKREAERIGKKAEVHAAKVRGVEFVVSEVRSGVER